MQHLEVVADRGLGELEVRQQVADARLRTLVREDQRQQAQPDRVRDRLPQRHDAGRPARR